MIDALLSDAEDRLMKEGLALRELLTTAQEVVFFGSRAAGCAAADSDLDLLCVGDGARVKSSQLDLLWVPGNVMASRQWLHSELAGHVAAYGIWIKGQRSWQPRQPSDAAIAMKRSVIVAEYDATRRHWAELALWARMKHLTSVRHNLQRLEILERGEAVPPTPRLGAMKETGADALLEYVSARMARFASLRRLRL